MLDRPKRGLISMRCMGEKAVFRGGWGWIVIGHGINMPMAITSARRRIALGGGDKRDHGLLRV